MSSHLHMGANSIMNALGTGPLTVEEIEVPGVVQVKRLGGGPTGLTVEMDAAFQVRTIPHQ